MEVEKEVPCFDFSQNHLKEGSEERKKLCKKVREACEEYGCFEVVYDNIPLDLHEDMFKALKEVFDLPLETKQKNSSGSNPHGYIGWTTPAIYETFRIPDPDKLSIVQAFTDLMWPDHGNPNICKTVNQIAKMIHELEHIIRKMVFESLGVEKYCDSNIEESDSYLRVTKYKTLLDDDITVDGLRAHCDNSLITILYHDVQGLEVLSKEGDWLQLVKRQGALTVLVGEALKAWSNGRVKAGKHRVMMKGAKERYSYGLFTSPKLETVVEVPKELVDKDHPLLYQPFKHKDFLQFYYSNFGRDNSVETFAGIAAPINNNGAC